MVSPSPLPPRLGGEIGVEHPAGVLGADADPLVGHADPHVEPGGEEKRVSGGELLVGGLHPDEPAPGHALVCVDHQVLEHLADLGGVDLGRPQAGLQLEEASRARTRKGEAHRVGHDLPHRRFPAHGGAAAGKGKELAGEALGACDGPFRLLEIRGDGAVGAAPQAGEAHVAQDGGEQVVEVVGDAPGQQPQALELLGSGHLGFHPPPLGDIAEDSPGGHRPALLEPAVGHALQEHAPAFSRDERHLDAAHVLPGEHRTEDPLTVLAAIRGDDVEQGEGRQVLAGIAKGAQPGAVRVEERPVGGHALDQVGGVLEEVPVLLLALGERLHGRLALGDVEVGEHHPAEAPVGVEEGGAAHVVAAVCVGPVRAPQGLAQRYRLREGARPRGAVPSANRLEAGTTPGGRVSPENRRQGLTVEGDEAHGRVEHHDTDPRAVEDGLDLLVGSPQLLVGAVHVLQDLLEGSGQDSDGVELEQGVVVELFGAQGHRAHDPQELVGLLPHIAERPSPLGPQCRVLRPQAGNLLPRAVRGRNIFLFPQTGTGRAHGSSREGPPSRAHTQMV